MQSKSSELNQPRRVGNHIDTPRPREVTNIRSLAMTVQLQLAQLCSASGKPYGSPRSQDGSNARNRILVMQKPKMRRIVNHVDTPRPRDVLFAGCENSGVEPNVTCSQSECFRKHICVPTVEDKLQNDNWNTSAMQQRKCVRLYRLAGGLSAQQLQRSRSSVDTQNLTAALPRDNHAHPIPVQREATELQYGNSNINKLATKDLQQTNSEELTRERRSRVKKPSLGRSAVSTSSIDPLRPQRTSNSSLLFTSLGSMSKEQNIAEDDKEQEEYPTLPIPAPSKSSLRVGQKHSTRRIAFEGERDQEEYEQHQRRKQQQRQEQRERLKRQQQRLQQLELKEQKHRELQHKKLSQSRAKQHEIDDAATNVSRRRRKKSTDPMDEAPFSTERRNALILPQSLPSFELLSSPSVEGKTYIMHQDSLILHNVRYAKEHQHREQRQQESSSDEPEQPPHFVRFTKKLSHQQQAPLDHDVVFNNAQLLPFKSHGWDSTRIDWLMELERRQEVRRRRLERSQRQQQRVDDQDELLSVLDVCCFPCHLIGIEMPPWLKKWKS